MSSSGSSTIFHSGLVKPNPNLSQASNAPQTQSPSESKPNQLGAEARHSFESEDSIALQKARASSSSPKEKSSIMSALDKARRKLSSSSSSKGHELPSSEAEFERLKEKEKEKERRKSEYERLGLNDKVKFGQGGMQMGN
ncbi:hypothetical protein BU16DRAFT_289471 [Lophium mytilinum]|uniref:Uncharacterized protein n=1 Tax=Lophium mytilinum TaxID=390894 RepID=A0A6A6R1N8_9PEZI|nr:hypothetical protein BU16DRAFT_289471 [Lophium mytilinum]